MNFRNLMIVLFVLVLALFRLVPHEPNFTPILAMALFAGLFFRNIKFAVLVPIAAMFVSDLFLGLHPTMLFVYLSLGLIAWMAAYLPAGRPWLATGAGGTLGAVLFFVVTNFGVWLMAGLYPLTVDGLLTSFAMGVPFFKNTLISTLVYGYGALAVWSLATRQLPALRGAQA